MPRPAGRWPYGRGEATPGGCPRFPWAGVARRHAPTGYRPRAESSG